MDVSSVAQARDDYEKIRKHLLPLIGRQINVLGTNFEPLRISSSDEASFMILRSGDRVLVCSEKSSSETIPQLKWIGGKRQGQETPVETMRREFQEETFAIPLQEKHWLALLNQPLLTHYNKKGRCVIFLIRHDFTETEMREHENQYKERLVEETKKESAAGGLSCPSQPLEIHWVDAMALMNAAANSERTVSLRNGDKIVLHSFLCEVICETPIKQFLKS